MTNQSNYTVESENPEGQEASLFDYISLIESNRNLFCSHVAFETNKHF